jgi:NDP-sugar pyrophosphorylase family protein
VFDCSQKQLLVLAGGFGTRLQSVLGEVPKALAPVCGKPFLYFQIDSWIKQGCKSFVFLLHHKADQIISFLKTEEHGLLKDCNFRFVIEPTPLGTGGSVAYAIKNLSLRGDFLVANADTWLGRGVGEMMMVSSPSILVVKVKNVDRYGQVLFDDNMFISGFFEKGKILNSGWINAGISCLSVDLFNGDSSYPYSLEMGLYPDLIERRLLKAVTISTEFIDIGIPNDYEIFCREIFHVANSNK